MKPEIVVKYICFKFLGRIEDAFYNVIDSLKDEHWPEFARVSHGLKLSDDVIDKIVEDFSKITKEQKYKLLKEWRRQNAGATAETIKALVEEFDRKVSAPRNGSQGQQAKAIMNFDRVTADRFNAFVEHYSEKK